MRVDTVVDRWAPDCRVTLGGQLLTHCLLADEEGGFAEIVEFDPAAPDQRRYMADAACPRGYRTRMVWGHVELRRHGAAASETVSGREEGV